MKPFTRCLAVSIVLISSACTTFNGDRISYEDIEIIAHRGVPRLAPENTLASALLAWKRGADAVEVDIRQTSDGQIVVIHDSSTLRVAEINRFIRHARFDELSVLDVGSHFSSRYTGERIPLLQSVLDAVPPGKQLYIEIKTDSTILPALSRMITESGIADRVRILSFNESVLEKAKQQLPSVPCYLLRFHVPRKSYTAFVSSLDRMNLDGADLFHGTITLELVTLLDSRGYTVITWTVDSLRTARRLISYGVTGVTTNVAGWFKKRLKD